MILVPMGNRFVRSSLFRIDSERIVSNKHFHHINKNSKSRKKRVEELRKYYEEHRKELAGSEK